MESKYDRVAYPENAYLHSDGEQEEFGTGVYPGVSIISRHHRRDDTIKIACFKVQRKFRLFLVIGAILFLFLLTLIIVLSTSGKKHLDSSENEPENMPQNTNDKTHGKFSRGLVGITALGGLWLSGRALASGAEGPEFEPPPG